MNKRNIYIYVLLAATTLGITSCDKFLDKLPDNRMELNNKEKIQKYLVSAYPDHNPAYLAELYSDNADEFDVTGWGSDGRFYDQAYSWSDITETQESESPQKLWNSLYTAMATANTALQTIEQQGNNSDLMPSKGEALLCRAYAALTLANTFCMAYDPTTASKNLGLPYPTRPETTVGTKYERGTLAAFYEQINRDIEEGLPLVTDNYARPKYKNKRIPAYEMIKFSVNMHQGCFGGCSFCTISAHQGKFVVCRSKESILNEVKKVAQMPNFKGYLSDLGGPSANMYGMAGRNKKACEVCKRPSCINPEICPNLNTDHSKLIEIYRAVDALPEIKKSFIGSGVRYDLLLHKSKDKKVNDAAMEYTKELIRNHVSGRLKVAPEHTSDEVLRSMRKPSFTQFEEFKRIFDKINKEENLRQQIIPYFMSSHPACKEADMADLAVRTKRLDFHLEQIQDFTPTPMTVSTEAWYTGYDPYTLEPVFSAKTPKDKNNQRLFFFWYKKEERQNIERELRKIGRPELINELYSSNDWDRQQSSGKGKEDDNNRREHKNSRKEKTYEAKPSSKTAERKSFNPNFCNGKPNKSKGKRR